MAEIPPPRRPLQDDREVDFLICKQCNSPCYVFDMDGSRIVDAQCLVCGNDTTRAFQLGDDAGSDD